MHVIGQTVDRYLWIYKDKFRFHKEKNEINKETKYFV